MDEFALIDAFFKSMTHKREDVRLGIGDDAACLTPPAGQALVVSCDTLVAEVHFLSNWDPYDIAYKAVMVNVSDLAAMAAVPAWAMLALTLPQSPESSWLKAFSNGLQDGLNAFNMALIGGDTTRGPFSLTLTVHGFAPFDKVVSRAGARPGDSIWVSGTLGAAALAVERLKSPHQIPQDDQAILMNQLLRPRPRVDLTPFLQTYATSAIDLSDGLSADLNHICEASALGACLNLDAIPVHAVVNQYKQKEALDFALQGGDDYELCFTVASEQEAAWHRCMTDSGLQCFCIGVMEAEQGLRIKESDGRIRALRPQGYSHF